MLLITDTVLISLIGACATVALAAVNGVFAVISNARGIRNEEHLMETKKAVLQVQTQTDGLSKDLAKVTGQKEYARGQHEGDALLDITAKAEFQKGLKQGTEEGNAKTVRSLKDKPGK